LLCQSALPLNEDYLACIKKQGDFNFALESKEADMGENFSHFAWFGEP
jgi:hypothetical protein